MHVGIRQAPQNAAPLLQPSATPHSHCHVHCHQFARRAESCGPNANHVCGQRRALHAPNWRRSLRLCLAARVPPRYLRREAQQRCASFACSIQSCFAIMSKLRHNIAGQCAETSTKITPASSLANSKQHCEGRTVLADCVTSARFSPYAHHQH